MENNQKPDLEQPPPKLSDRIDTNVKIIIAFFLGAILAGTLVQFALPILAAHASELMIGFIAVIGLLAIIALIFTIFKEFFFKLFFGISKADLEEVKTSAESMAGNAVKQDWIAASKDFKVVSQKGSAWYAWLSYRRWVVTVFYTLFLAFAGLLGSVLLYNQNQLLEKQNEKLDTQNLKIDSQIQLEESSRRGNLIVMMSNIMDKVDDELTNDWNNDDKRNLSPQLIGRIAALSQSFRPYHFWQDSSLTKNPLSPERGQLLLALVNSNLDSMTYQNIYKIATFENTYLEKATMFGKYLNGAKLSKARLRYVDFRHVNFENTDLSEADLRNTDFGEANLKNANLFRANLSAVNLHESKLINATLSEANLSSADLSEADLSNADLGGANLEKSILIGAKLSNITLRTKAANVEYVGGEYIHRQIIKEINLSGAKVREKNWINLLKPLQIEGLDKITGKYKVVSSPEGVHIVFGNFYQIKEKNSNE